MKRYLYLLLLLLIMPVQAWAVRDTTGFKLIRAAKKPVPPAAAVEMVNQRTGSGKVYRLNGDARMAVASAGIEREVDSIPRAAITAGYRRMMKVGQSTFEYDSSGSLRYQKGAVWFTVKPAFNTNNVGVEFEFNNNGLKACYTIPEKSSGRLAWRLNDPYKIAGRKILPFTAVDSTGKSLPVKTIISADSVIAEVNMAGAVGPVVVDPSILDSAQTAASGFITAVKAGYASARDTVAGTAAVAYHSASGALPFVMNTYAAPDYYVNRMALSFVVPDELRVADSAKIYIKNISTGGEPLSFIAGTFTGAIGTSWFNDFTGWAAGSAHTPTYYTDSLITANGWNSVSVTATGLSAIEAAAGDTLRVMVLHNRDIDRTTPIANDEANEIDETLMPYIVIYYRYFPPGVTSDSASSTIDSVFAPLWATVDSTGGPSLDVRGFQLYMKGNTVDTLDTHETGSFAAGSFGLISPMLRSDTAYYYRPYAAHTDTSYGAWQELSTDSGGTIRVLGRTVNTLRY